MRRHVPRPAAAEPPPDLASDCGRGVPLATEMRRDIHVRRTRLRLAVGVTDVALVLRQQGARIDRRRTVRRAPERHREDECGERSDCTEGYAPSSPSWARRSAERTAVSESCHEDPSVKGICLDADFIADQPISDCRCILRDRAKAILTSVKDAPNPVYVVWPGQRREAGRVGCMETMLQKRDQATFDGVRAQHRSTVTARADDSDRGGNGKPSLPVGADRTRPHRVGAGLVFCLFPPV